MFVFVCLFVCFSTVEEFEIKSARYFRCTGKHRYEVFAKRNEVRQYLRAQRAQRKGRNDIDRLEKKGALYTVIDEIP